MKFRIILIVISVLMLGSFAYFAVTVSANNSSDISTVIPAVTAEPVSYDDVLSTMHNGQWFGWRDPDNKIYENLLVLDSQYSKPTKPELLNAMVALQAERNSILLERTALQATRSEIETRIFAGTYDKADLIDYLRILGGF